MADGIDLPLLRQLVAGLTAYTHRELAARWDPTPLLPLTSRPWQELTADDWPQLVNWHAAVVTSSRHPSLAKARHGIAEYDEILGVGALQPSVHNRTGWNRRAE